MPPFFMPTIIIFFQKPLLLKNKSSTFAKIMRTKDTKVLTEYYLNNYLYD